MGFLQVLHSLKAPSSVKGRQHSRLYAPRGRVTWPRWGKIGADPGRLARRRAMLAGTWLASPTGMTLLHHPEDSAPDAVEHVLEPLHSFETAMLRTTTMEGALHARPMAVAEVENGGTVWFVTDVTSSKMGDIGADPAVLLAFQDTRRYLTVTGEAVVVRSPEKV